MTDTQIDELMTAITQEPWLVGPDVAELLYRYSNFIHAHNRAVARVLHEADARFIAAAPALIRQLRSERDVARAAMAIHSKQFAEDLNKAYLERFELQQEVATLSKQLADLQRERSGLLEIKAQWDEAIAAGLIIVD